jgi:uncharacterized membrane protein YedE/YeeE
MMRIVSAFSSGFVFAVGLGVGGMTQPTRVLGFLDIAGHWDPSLAVVMAGAVIVYGVLFRLIRRRSRPILARTFSLPTRRDVDARLVVGSAIFGLGWGLAGYCPGPAIVTLATGAAPMFVFVAAMVAGMAVVDALDAPSMLTSIRDRAVRAGKEAA